MKRYFLYLLRWQCSTPILWGVLLYLNTFSTLVATIIANLVGGCIFFFVDRWIFSLGNRKVEIKTSLTPEQESLFGTLKPTNPPKVR